MYWLNEYATGLDNTFKISDNSVGSISFYSDFTSQILEFEQKNKKVKLPDINLYTDLINNFSNIKKFSTAIDFYLFDLITKEKKAIWGLNIPIVSILYKAIIRNMLLLFFFGIRK